MLLVHTRKIFMKKKILVLLLAVAIQSVAETPSEKSKKEAEELRNEIRTAISTIIEHPVVQTVSVSVGLACIGSILCKLKHVDFFQAMNIYPRLREINNSGTAELVLSINTSRVYTHPNIYFEAVTAGLLLHHPVAKVVNKLSHLFNMSKT